MPLPSSVPKVAVVTGSSSGIGRATALQLARAGYAVVLHARRNLAGLQGVARELLQLTAGARTPVLCLTGDIACGAACRQLVSSAFGWHGRVDVWVNNAGADVLTGAAGSQPFEARLEQLLNVDVRGTIRLSRLVVDRMADQPDRIAPAGAPGPLPPAMINMSWDQASLGMEGEPGQLFGTTKAAVAAFTSSLALTAPWVRINCVAPGWIQTEWGQTAASDYWSQRAREESLLRRWGKADDVAQAIVWLASECSQFVNGQTLCINGGRRYYPSVYKSSQD